MREPKPFYRKQTKSWYVKLSGEWVNLGKNKEEAFETYHDMMSKRRERPTARDSAAKLLDTYWQHIVKNLADTTCERRKPILKSFGEFIGPKLTIRRLRPYHVLNWITAKYPDAGDTYKNTLMTVVKGAFQWADDAGYIEANPIKKLKKPEPTVRQEFVPADVWPQVIALATDQPLKDFLTVMLSSGARVQEMFKVEARHIQGRRVIFGIDEGKGYKARVIWLPDDAYEIVVRLLVDRPEGRLFRNSRGRAWNRNSLRCRFRRLKRELKMPKLTATTLRHSFAHHRLTSGQDSLVVAKLMGHVDGRMLATRYGHLEQNSNFMLNEANRIENPLGQAPPPDIPQHPSNETDTGRDRSRRA